MSTNFHHFGKDLLVIGFEPILCIESDFKSDVSTNSTKRVQFLQMAQFDSLIIFVLILSLVFVLILHYDIVIEILIPGVSETKKFSEKKNLSVNESFNFV